MVEQEADPTSGHGGLLLVGLSCGVVSTGQQGPEVFVGESAGRVSWVGDGCEHWQVLAGWFKSTRASALGLLSSGDRSKDGVKRQ